MALIVVIPLVIGFVAYRNITNNRISDNAQSARQNAALIARLDNLQYASCLENEQQDAVIVSTLQAAINIVIAALPPGDFRQAQVNLLLDNIRTLEPPNEKDCVPPKGTGP